MSMRKVMAIRNHCQKPSVKLGTNRPAQMLSSHARKHMTVKIARISPASLEKSLSKSSVVLVSTGDQRERPKSLQTDCRSNVRSGMPAYDCFPGSSACIKAFNGANNGRGHPSCCCTLYVHNVLSWKPFMVARRARELVRTVARPAFYGILPIVHPINKLLAKSLHG